MKKHPIIKYDFKELLDKGYRDLPTGTINNNYCFILNHKVDDVIIK